MNKKQYELTISGMTCKGCETTVARLLAEAGVEDSTVSFSSGKAWITIHPQKLPMTQVVAKINASKTYHVEHWQELKETNVPQPSKPVRKILIIGGGSAAFAAAIRAAELGVAVTMINDGLPIGGTCVNVGCIPSKTLLSAAARWHSCHVEAFQGIHCKPGKLTFQEVIQQKDKLVSSLRRQKYLDVLKQYPNIQFIEGRARLVGAQTVAVGKQRFAGDRIIIATGASPWIPDIPGIREVPYLTSTTALELPRVPESLIVIGGRFIALELAQMFRRFGSQVTILQRSARILPHLPSRVGSELTRILEDEGITIHTGVQLHQIQGDERQVIVKFEQNRTIKTLQAQKILVATGRHPNTENLGLEALGIKRNANGGLWVNDYLQTNVPGIFAAGDVLGEHMLVYTAAYEGKLAAENAIRGLHISRDYTALPWVLFTDPQVAGVGLDENTAQAKGIPAESVTLPLSEVPRALADRSTRGFIQLVRNSQNDKIIGGIIMAPTGGEVIMEIALAIRLGITSKQLTEFFHPYLTLAEGIKLSSLAFRKDIRRLSCCAT